MLESDAQSRIRLIFIGGFLAVLFGSFALMGVIHRLDPRTADAHFSAPLPIHFDPEELRLRRVALLAEENKRNATHNRLIAFASKERWRQAAELAGGSSVRNEDYSLKFLQSEALMRLGNQKGSVEMAALLGGRRDVTSGELALLRGDTTFYRDACTKQLGALDEKSCSAVDANNTAWLCSIAPGATDPAGAAKAVRLSERAVASVRAQQDLESLATYSNTLGAAYLRAGRFQDARSCLMESERLEHDPFNYPFLALADYNLGDIADAILWRNQLRLYLTNTYGTGNGQRYRYELLLLLHETCATVR